MSLSRWQADRQDDAEHRAVDRQEAPLGFHVGRLRVQVASSRLPGSLEPDALSSRPRSKLGEGVDLAPTHRRRRHAGAPDRAAPRSWRPRRPPCAPPRGPQARSARRGQLLRAVERPPTQSAARALWPAPAICRLSEGRVQHHRVAGFQHRPGGLEHLVIDPRVELRRVDLRRQAIDRPRARQPLARLVGPQHHCAGRAPPGRAALLSARR